MLLLPTRMRIQATVATHAVTLMTVTHVAVTLLAVTWFHLPRVKPKSSLRSATHLLTSAQQSEINKKTNILYKHLAQYTPH
jgi:hypothetical protein